jgi:hypothetical protein
VWYVCRVENVLRNIAVTTRTKGKVQFMYTYDLDDAISANARIYCIIMRATTIYDGCSYRRSAAAVVYSVYTYEFIWIDMTSMKTEFYVLYLDGKAERQTICLTVTQVYIY